MSDTPTDRTNNERSESTSALDLNDPEALASLQKAPQGSDGKAARIVITTHARPDGDAIGSSLGLCHYLRKKGHEAKVVVPNSYADFLRWIPGQELVLDYQRSRSECTKVFKQADIIFCLDFNHPDRIESLRKELDESRAPVVMIDHHRNPSDFAKWQYWSIEASSTAELVFDFITLVMGDEGLMDKDIATGLYTGILTDTGSFQYNSTTPNTHRVTSELLKFGLDKKGIYDRIYSTFSEDRLRFFGHCLSNKMEIFPEFQTGLIWVTQEEINRFRVRTGDTEGLVNYPLSIQGVIFSALIIDRIAQIKISFRSRGDYSVEQFAKRHFSGGGHKNASGGTSYDSLDVTVARFKQLIKEEPDLRRG